ncbi:hypothetical protein [Candidatus Albibeggiatoa sp. nov. BB20]
MGRLFFILAAQYSYHLGMALFPLQFKTDDQTAVMTPSIYDLT